MFFSGRQRAGENLKDVLARRAGESAPPIPDVRWPASSSRPVVGRGLVFSPMGSGTCPLWAIRPNERGVVTDTHVAWEYQRAVPKRSSILLVDDLLFMVDDGGVGACLEAKNCHRARQNRPPLGAQGHSKRPAW